METEDSRNLELECGQMDQLPLAEMTRVLSFAPDAGRDRIDTAFRELAVTMDVS